MSYFTVFFLLFHSELHKIYYHMTRHDQEKETQLLAFLRVMVKLSKNPALKDVCKRILTSNLIGPIVFICPELGKWSTAGGLGVMVYIFFSFQLAKKFNFWNFIVG